MYWSGYADCGTTVYTITSFSCASLESWYVVVLMVDGKDYKVAGYYMLQISP